LNGNCSETGRRPIPCWHVA